MRHGKVDKVQGYHILTRVPSEAELLAAIGKGATTSNPSEGCTVQGTLHIPQVGGTFSVTVSKHVWAEANAFALFGLNNPAGGAPRTFHNVR